jgi:hypothetical protein
MISILFDRHPLSPTLPSILFWRLVAVPFPQIHHLPGISLPQLLFCWCVLIVPASITSSAFPDSYSRVGLCLYPCPITRHSPLSSLCSHFWGASPALHCSLWIIHRPSLLFYTITSCPLLPLLLSFTEFPGFDCSAWLFPLIKWLCIYFQSNFLSYSLKSQARKISVTQIYQALPQALPPEHTRSEPGIVTKRLTSGACRKSPIAAHEPKMDRSRCWLC